MLIIQLIELDETIVCDFEYSCSLNSEESDELNLAADKYLTVDSEEVEIDFTDMPTPRTGPPVTAKNLEKQVDKLVEEFNRLADTLKRPKFVEPIPEEKTKSSSKDSIAEEKIIIVPKTSQSISEKNIISKTDESIVEVIKSKEAKEVEEKKSERENESRSKKAITEGKIPLKSEEKIIPKSDESVRPKETLREKEVTVKSTESMREDKLVSKSKPSVPEENKFLKNKESIHISPREKFVREDESQKYVKEKRDEKLSRKDENIPTIQVTPSKEIVREKESASKTDDTIRSSKSKETVHGRKTKSHYVIKREIAAQVIPMHALR